MTKIFKSTIKTMIKLNKSLGWEVSRKHVMFSRRWLKKESSGYSRPNNKKRKNH